MTQNITSPSLLQIKNQSPAEFNIVVASYAAHDTWCGHAQKPAKF